MPDPPTAMPAAVSARHWHREAGGVCCDLCPHECRLGPNEVGVCGVRRRVGDELVSDVYGRVAVARPATVESKVLYHFLPGAKTYSFAAPGCNLRCRFCQNWLVSQAPKGAAPSLDGRELSPAGLVAEAVAAGCTVLACTYTEPSVFFEFAMDAARLARAAGLRVVWKTNGYLNAAPQREAADWLDAVNVDIKTARDATYRRVVGGRLRPVLEAARRYGELGVWTEVATPVIPTVNDSDGELAALGRFILHELGPDTPWHLTRFHPDYELRGLPPTSAEKLAAARQQALALGLRYVYTDAAPRGDGWNTVCRGCGAVVVERAQYGLVASRLTGAACSECGERLAGVYE